MTITVDEVYETASMILYQNLDIRTTTLGINLKDCIDSDFKVFKKNVYEKVSTNAKKLVEHARALELKYGIPIANKRISITPASLIMESHCTKAKFIQMAKTLALILSADSAPWCKKGSQRLIGCSLMCCRMCFPRPTGYVRF